MAYSDYGAEVYKNDVRRNDKEDAPLFATDEEVFGEDIENIPNGERIFIHLLRCKGDYNVYNQMGHGVIGDGNIRVLCYKTYLPSIFEITEDGVREINYLPEGRSIYADEPYDIEYEYEGYKFHFFGEATPFTAIMIEPDGDRWECNYGCCYGAGFEDEE